MARKGLTRGRLNLAQNTQSFQIRFPPQCGSACQATSCGRSVRRISGLNIATPTRCRRLLYWHCSVMPRGRNADTLCDGNASTFLPRPACGWCATVLLVFPLAPLAGRGSGGWGRGCLRMAEVFVSLSPTPLPEGGGLFSLRSDMREGLYFSAGSRTHQFDPKFRIQVATSRSAKTTEQLCENPSAVIISRSKSQLVVIISPAREPTTRSRFGISSAWRCVKVMGEVQV